MGQGADFPSTQGEVGLREASEQNHFFLTPGVNRLYPFACPLNRDI